MPPRRKSAVTPRSGRRKNRIRVQPRDVFASIVSDDSDIPEDILEEIVVDHTTMRNPPVNRYMVMPFPASSPSSRSSSASTRRDDACSHSDFPSLPPMSSDVDSTEENESNNGDDNAGKVEMMQDIIGYGGYGAYYYHSYSSH